MQYKLETLLIYELKLGFGIGLKVVKLTSQNRVTHTSPSPVPPSKIK